MSERTFDKDKLFATRSSRRLVEVGPIFVEVGPILREYGDQKVGNLRTWSGHAHLAGRVRLCWSDTVSWLTCQGGSLLCTSFRFRSHAWCRADI